MLCVNPTAIFGSFFGPFSCANSLFGIGMRNKTVNPLRFLGLFHFLKDIQMIVDVFKRGIARKIMKDFFNGFFDTH